ncbi:hypothetical protein P8452_59112 [Trifolium repens]|nr:hypothetical protein P8452_59112 [Trifolium repens]
MPLIINIPCKRDRDCPKFSLSPKYTYKCRKVSMQSPFPIIPCIRDRDCPRDWLVMLQRIKPLQIQPTLSLMQRD